MKLYITLLVFICMWFSHVNDYRCQVSGVSLSIPLHLTRLLRIALFQTGLRKNGEINAWAFRYFFRSVGWYRFREFPIRKYLLMSWASAQLLSNIVNDLSDTHIWRMCSWLHVRHDAGFVHPVIHRGFRGTWVWAQVRLLSQPHY